jgi:hypothetical protein
MRVAVAFRGCVHNPEPLILQWTNYDLAGE